MIKTESILCERSKNVLVKLVKQTDEIKKLSEVILQNINEGERDIIRRVLEYFVFFNISQMDIFAILNMFGRNTGLSLYNNLFLTKNYIVAHREVYRKLINFQKHSDSEYCYYWICTVKPAVQTLFPEFTNSYNAITTKLREQEKLISSLKERRDIAVHYDLDPIKCYNMIEQLNVNVVLEEIKPFSDLLSDIAEFNALMLAMLVKRYF